MAKYTLNRHDPTIRGMIIDKYNEQGANFVWKEFGIPDRTVRRWKELEKKTGTLKPRFEGIGSELKLSRREVKRLEQKLLDDPYATNEELAAVVQNKITPRSAGNYVNRSDFDFRWKLEQEDVEVSFTEKNADEGRKFKARIKNIPLNKRVYVDETQISSGIRRRKGRFPKGVKPWTPKNRFYPRQTIIGAIKKKKWLIKGSLYNKGSITTQEFEEWVRDELAPELQPGDNVFWDRWGRSGRAKNPVAHHYSPSAKAAIEACGARLIFLPPAGKHFDPIEMIFGDTKRIFEKKMGKIMLKMNPSKIPLSKKQQLWQEAASQIKPNSFERAYKERANGNEFLRVCKEKGL